MLRGFIIVPKLAIVLGLIVTSFSPASPQGKCDDDKWLGSSLEEMRTIKAGMTRADLLKVFAQEGGLSTRTHERFVYRHSQLIHVDVEFEAGSSPGDAENKESAHDKIRTISRPYLDNVITD
ncbi:MAG: hypothetical protein ACJ741_12675 [Pyrinomonadaceae bacterium]